ncbi:MAG: hypothetical protein RR869_10310, partial [Lachnospiraceae bacterium]
IIPWMMEKMDDEDFMLYALLNGGAPYFIRDGAYQNIDGSFGGHTPLSEKEMADRCNVVTQLHKKIATCEMVSHEILHNDAKLQRATYSDGTIVEINLHEQTYIVK